MPQRHPPPPTWAEQAAKQQVGGGRLHRGGRQHCGGHRGGVHGHLLAQVGGVSSAQRGVDVQQRIPQLLVLHGGRVVLQVGHRQTGRQTGRRVRKLSGNGRELSRDNTLLLLLEGHGRVQCSAVQRLHANTAAPPPGPPPGAATA